MKLTIKRLRERDQYIWNLTGAECKLKVNGTTFRPTSKTLGHNLENFQQFTKFRRRSTTGVLDSDIQNEDFYRR